MNVATTISPSIGRQLGNLAQYAASATPSELETGSASVAEEEITQCLVQIGNTDNKLSQEQWANFIAATRECVNLLAEDIFMEGFSLPDAPWQNACWAFSCGDRYITALRTRLGIIAGDFHQDSIAFNIMRRTEFIPGSFLTKAELEKNLNLEATGLGMPKGVTNVYVCPVCRGQVVTVHVDRGVTPSRMSCRVTEDCKGAMYSTGYRQGDQSLIPNYVWYRPESNEGRFHPNDDVDEHIRKGGLILQPVSDYIGE